VIYIFNVAPKSTVQISKMQAILREQM